MQIKWCDWVRSGYTEWAVGVHREEKESSQESLNDKQKLVQRWELRLDKKRQVQGRYKGLKVDKKKKPQTLPYDYSPLGHRDRPTEKWDRQQKSDHEELCKQVKEFGFGLEGDGDWCQAMLSAMFRKRANLEVRKSKHYLWDHISPQRQLAVYPSPVSFPLFLTMSFV